jgi:hypothetical protein
MLHLRLTRTAILLLLGAILVLVLLLLAPVSVGARAGQESKKGEDPKDAPKSLLEVNGQLDEKIPWTPSTRSRANRTW